MEQQKCWECFEIKTGRWVEFKLYWVRLTLPAASIVVRVAVGRARGARLAVLIRQVTSRILFCPYLNPVDYAVWGILQERVYKHQRITDVEELPACWEGMGEWDRLNQEVIDNAISEWRKRLTACVSAGGGHFEHSLCTLLHLFTYWLTCSKPC